jgi:hypothetical protein
LGTAHHTRLLPQPFRVVVLNSDKLRPDGTPDRPVLVTNRLDLEAELVALAFRYRWSVELFFRWVNPTTTSVLDRLFFPAYAASKSTDHDQEAEDVSGMSDRRRVVHRPYV